MVIPVAIPAIEKHQKQGYKWTAAISYQDGTIYPLYGCTLKTDALRFAKGWIKARQKKNEICKDILLRD